MTEASVSLGDVYQLWDELSDHHAAQIDDALRMLMSRLCAILRGDNVMWIGAVRLGDDRHEEHLKQHGWRARVITHLHADQKRDAMARRAMRNQADSACSMTNEALTRDAGRFRSHRLHDGFVDFERFSRTSEYQWLYRATGVADRMWVVFPVNDDSESYFVIDRGERRPGFSVRDEALAAHVLRGIKWFHRRLLLSHGLLIADKPLSPMERRITHFLLSDMAEKQIAAELGLATTTLHSYVTAIYRRFDVRGRTGFHALWHGALDAKSAERKQMTQVA